VPLPTILLCVPYLKGSHANFPLTSEGLVVGSSDAERKYASTIRGSNEGLRRVRLKGSFVGDE
jgi:hypothetical protein